MARNEPRTDRVERVDRVELSCVRRPTSRWRSGAAGTREKPDGRTREFHATADLGRSLKPANIKVRPDGTVKVLDFGLAKALEPASSANVNATASPTITSPAMTGVGVLLGTAAYMSPEQARGKPIDKRSDIWAFGCVLYEMLTGRRAFEDEDVSMTLSKVLQREPDFEAFPANVPPRVRQTIRMCLRKSSRERVADIHDARLALEGVFETASADSAPPMAVVQPVWRRALPFLVTAVVVALITGAAASSFWPTIPTATVSRFDYVLPSGQQFRNAGRPVMAFSSDGRRIVYNTTRGLYLRSLDALEPRLISGTEMAAVNPFLSPDGESIGFWDAQELKRISINGGTAVAICAAMNAPFGVSWGRDGTILFGQLAGVWRVSANGGTPEVVIPAKADERMDGPQLLPDGDSVLFSVTTASGDSRWDAAQIVVQSLSTGNRKVLLQGGSDARYIATGHLVYAVGEALFAVRFELRRLDVIGAPVSVVEGVTPAGNPTTNTASAHYAVSDTGTLVYVKRGAVGGFSADVFPRTVLWVDRQGREEALNAPARPYVYPRLSPDGTRVALDVRDEGEDIWIWNLRQQTMTRATLDPSLDGLPVWAPDGQRLVWSSQRGGSALNLYWQAADGTGTPERLTDSPNAHRASSFTPDGLRCWYRRPFSRRGRISRCWRWKGNGW